MEKRAVNPQDIKEVENLKSELGEKFTSIQEALAKDPTLLARLFNKAKTLASQLNVGEQVLPAESLDQQQNESTFGYMTRLSRSIDEHGSYSDALRENPDLIARFYNNIPQLIQESKTQLR